GTYGRNAHRGSLQRDDRTGLMTGGDDRYMRLQHQRMKLPLGEKPMESHLRAEAERGGELPHLTAQRVFTDDVEAQLRMPGCKPRHGTQQSRLILHPVETGHVDQPRRLARPARHRLTTWPVADVIHTERHTTRCDAAARKERELRLTRRGDGGRPRHHHRL